MNITMSLCLVNTHPEASGVLVVVCVFKADAVVPAVVFFFFNPRGEDQTCVPVGSGREDFTSGGLCHRCTV